MSVESANPFDNLAENCGPCPIARYILMGMTDFSGVKDKLAECDNGPKVINACGEEKKVCQHDKAGEDYFSGVQLEQLRTYLTQEVL